MPHDVIFLLVPDFQLLDMSGPAAVFQTAGKQAHRRRSGLCGSSWERGGPVRSSCGVEVLTRSWRDAPSGTLVVPGGEGARAAAVTRPCAGICTRIAGRPAPGQRLHGRIRAGGRGPARRAARHHSLASCRRARAQPSGRASRRRPIHVCDGDTWTSAGITAGIDLALAMVESDLGARRWRAPRRADGGLPPLGRPVAVLGAAGPGARQQVHPRRAGAHPRESWRGADCRASGRRGLCQPAPVPAQLQAETGETPAKAVETHSGQAARAPQAGADSIDSVARRAGFTDSERMRRTFLRGQPPPRAGGAWPEG